MNGNGHRPPLAFPGAVPILGQPFALAYWHVEIVLMCKCERPMPVVIIGQPKQAAGQCQSCGRVYGLAAIGLHPQTGQPQFSFSIATPAPAGESVKGEVTS